MREKGIAYPRTCTECGLGPCKAFPPAGLAAAIGQPLPACQAIVIEEKSDLDVRFARLKAFIESDEVHKLGVDERTRLVRQRAAMHAYSQVLGERIAAFEADESGEVVNYGGSA